MSPPNDESLQKLEQAADETLERTRTYLPDSVRSDPDLPAHLGRYRIEGEIARGGMGKIVRVHDQEFQRPLAMKVLLAAADESPELTDRFFREARLTGQLQHPGIAPVQEMGRLPDGRPYFIMKLVQGSSLKALLQKRASLTDDLPRFVAIFEQICQTLAYAHSQGVIHRDLKPANIMVGAFGEVQVMDWGLAKEVGTSAARQVTSIEPTSTSVELEMHTQAGRVMGTPAYMAPEQARGEMDLDPRVDVFGLGAILCEILTGQPPFAAGNSDANLRLARAGALSEAVSRLEACGADTELTTLCRVCLAGKREDRPALAGEVAQAVAAYQAELQRRRSGQPKAT